MRLNPTRLIDADVWPWTPSPDGKPAWGTPVAKRLTFVEQPESTADLAVRGRLLVPNPSTPVGVHARVDIDGRVFSVVGAKKVYARRRSPFAEFTVVDPLPRHLGWTVTVTAVDAGGMDDNNDPLPDATRHLTDAVLVPAGSLEPDDRSIDPVSSAQLYLPPGESVTSTTSITIAGSPLPSRWQVVGHPDMTPTRTVVTLSRG